MQVAGAISKRLLRVIWCSFAIHLTRRSGVVVRMGGQLEVSSK